MNWLEIFRTGASLAAPLFNAVRASNDADRARAKAEAYASVDQFIKTQRAKVDAKIAKQKNRGR